MNLKGRPKKPGYDWSGELVRYMNSYLEYRGLHPRKVFLVTDAPYPSLPKHFAARIELLKPSGLWFESRAWAEPESYVDLLNAMEQWLERIAKG